MHSAHYKKAWQARQSGSECGVNAYIQTNIVFLYFYRNLKEICRFEWIDCSNRRLKAEFSTNHERICVEKLELLSRYIWYMYGIYVCMYIYTNVIVIVIVVFYGSIVIEVGGVLNVKNWN